VPRAEGLQGQIDELIKRVSDFRAQYDERRDHQIEAEMHALTKKPCNGLAREYAADEPNAFTLLVMLACFDLRRTRRQRLSTVAGVVAADVTLFCNGFDERYSARGRRGNRPGGGGDVSLARKTAGFRRRGRDPKAPLRARSCFDGHLQVLHAVENLEAPQHDNNGRNQGGNGQHTLQGSHSHDTLRFPTPSSGLVDSRNRRQSTGHVGGDVILRLWFAGHSGSGQQKDPAMRGLFVPRPAQ
jgi:hypothetical protein